MVAEAHHRGAGSAFATTPSAPSTAATPLRTVSTWRAAWSTRPRISLRADSSCRLCRCATISFVVDPFSSFTVSTVTNMPDVTYEKDITGLVVIDPYNDFISEDGKYGIA